jgi:hypothetical protein
MYQIAIKVLHLKTNNECTFFSINDERLYWLEYDFLPYISFIKQASEECGRQFITKQTYEALVLTTKCTVDCIKYLLDCGYHYVLTRAFNSDPIESLFSALRQMNGGNDVMDVRTTLFSMEKILKTGHLVTSKYSNVGKSDGLICTKTPPINKRNSFAPQIKTSNLPEQTLEILDQLLVEQGKFCQSLTNVF